MSFFKPTGPCDIIVGGIPLGRAESVEVKLVPHIRYLIVRDQPAVLEIEQASYADPWHEDDFKNALRDRSTMGFVAESGEDIVGFMIVQFQPRQFYVFDLAVAPKYRRYGVGQAMIDKLKGKLRHEPNVSGICRRRIVIELPETNVPAQMFLKAQGFRCVRQVRGYFDGQDCYQMRYQLPEDDGQDDECGGEA